jgi:hypothetical protein
MQPKGCFLDDIFRFRYFHLPKDKYFTVILILQELQLV